MLTASCVMCLYVIYHFKRDWGRWHCFLLTTDAFRLPEGKSCAEVNYLLTAIHDIMKAESYSIDSKVNIFYRLKSLNCSKQ